MSPMWKSVWLNSDCDVAETITHLGDSCPVYFSFALPYLVRDVIRSNSDNLEKPFHGHASPLVLGEIRQRATSDSFFDQRNFLVDV